MPRPAHTPEPTLRLYLLGAFRLEKDGVPVNILGRKARALLAYLALHPEPHAREQLAERFWDSATETDARLSLRVNLARLKKISPNLLLADTDTVQLNPEAGLWSDAQEFSNTRDWKVASNALQDSDSISGLSESYSIRSLISLYRGDLLPEFYDDWVLQERERLRQLYLDALLDLVQHYRSQSEYKRAIETAHTILQIDRANERAYQHVMFCHVASGDRSAALVQYAACERALREELSVEPSQETTALYTWIQQTPPESRSLSARITNLPIPLTSFIGRQSTLGQIKRLLRDTRLVTLTGAGGSGKTRLAIQTGMDLVNHFRDGVWWVELAALTDPSLVPDAIAKALGVRESTEQSLLETISNVLHDRQLLLVLDNCEHLITACAQVVERLLKECSFLTILATSREFLNIGGETVYPVPTLNAPRTESISLLPLLLEFESVRLFVERAHSHSPSFALTRENAATVVQICQRLDGIPLALELAAARVRALSVEQIALRLDDRFNLLTRGARTALPRQQTLRALIDWSYNLLSAEEQLLFRRLAVFEGGWTFEAVEAVCTRDGEIEAQENMPTLSQSSPDRLTSSVILELLTQLVEKSLVVYETNAEGGRYHFLETLREYAREKLEALPQAHFLHDEHSTYFVDLAERAYPHVRYGQGLREWLEQLALESENLRAALKWTYNSGQAIRHLQMAAALAPYWEMRGHLSEGLQWLRGALALAPAVQEPQVLGARAQAQVGVGILALYQGDDPQARADFQIALGLYEKIGDWTGMGFALDLVATVTRNEFEFDRALEFNARSRACFERANNAWGSALALDTLGYIYYLQGAEANALETLTRAMFQSEQIGDKRILMSSLKTLGRIARHRNDFDTAVAHFEQVLHLGRDLGDEWTIGTAYKLLGDTFHEKGDLPRARALLISSLEIMRRIGDSRFPLRTLINFSLLALQAGELTRAAILAAAIEQLYVKVQSAPPQPESSWYESVLEETRSQLPPQALESARQRGQKLSLDEAIALALE